MQPTWPKIARRTFVRTSRFRSYCVWPGLRQPGDQPRRRLIVHPRVRISTRLTSSVFPFSFVPFSFLPAWILFLPSFCKRIRLRYDIAGRPGLAGLYACASGCADRTYFSGILAPTAAVCGSPVRHPAKSSGRAALRHSCFSVLWSWRSLVLVLVCGVRASNPESFTMHYALRDVSGGYSRRGDIGRDISPSDTGLCLRSLGFAHNRPPVQFRIDRLGNAVSTENPHKE